MKAVFKTMKEQWTDEKRIFFAPECHKTTTRPFTY